MRPPGRITTNIRAAGFGQPRDNTGQRATGVVALSTGRTVGIAVGAVLVVVLTGTLIVRASEVAGLPGRALPSAVPPTSPAIGTVSAAVSTAPTGAVAVTVPPITPTPPPITPTPPPTAAPAPPAAVGGG